MSSPSAICSFLNNQQMNLCVNTYPLTSGSQNLFVGGINGYSATSLKGNIDEVRISKGIAWWTSNFTPPDHEYGPVVGPVANFTGVPLSVTAPLTVQFTDTSLNYPTSWNWSFGDGAFSSAQNPSYTYNRTGLYTVNLTVSDAAGGDTEVKPVYVDVTGQAPGTDFTVPAYQPLVPSTSAPDS